MDNIIELKNLCKDFNAGTVDEVALFNDFNFSVKRGDFVSVIGSNGSGKTTMLSIICGSMPIKSGKILFEGRDITKKPEHVRARRIGRVFQDPSKGTCPDLTILENMALADNKGKLYSLFPALRKMRIAHYKELLKTCEMGLENRINVPVGKLSGGQRQALALIIANMTNIDLLILDEHTAALDPKTSETIMRLTEKLVKDKNVTTLMVTHNLRFAVEYGNRIIMMHEGNIVLDKSDEEKNNIKVDELLHKFNEISIECGN